MPLAYSLKLLKTKLLRIDYLSIPKAPRTEIHSLEQIYTDLFIRLEWTMFTVCFHILGTRATSRSASKRPSTNQKIAISWMFHVSAFYYPFLSSNLAISWNSAICIYRIRSYICNITYLSEMALVKLRLMAITLVDCNKNMFYIILIQHIDT